MAEVKLTAAQQAVVENRGGALLVSAAAGSGKTKVLVDRLMGYILEKDDPANIDEFLIITFTNAAAAELRVKIAAELGKRLALQPDNRHLQHQLTRVYLTQISTVHAFCTAILRQYAHELDIPADFRIAEQQETNALREQVLSRVLAEQYEKNAENPAFRALLDSYASGRDDRKLKELLLPIYDTVRCRKDPKAWLNACRKSMELSTDTPAEETPWGAYLMQTRQQALRQAEQMLQMGISALRGDEALEASYLPTFEENLALVRKRQKDATWDAVAEHKITTFDRLKTVRSCENPDAKEQAQALRADALKAIKKAEEAFYAPSQKIVADLKSSADAISGLFDVLKAFHAEFSKEKRRRKIMDFSDLEQEAIRLLTDPATGKPTAAAREISARFREIMVDEYQDSNEVQECIFEAVSKAGQNRFMVGDVKQSIYRFRMAEPGIFQQKYETFAPGSAAEPGQMRKLILSENFRSRPEILLAVNDVFSLVMHREAGELDYGEDEALSPGRQFPETPQTKVELHAIDLDIETGEDEADAEKTEEEAAFVAARIDRLLREKTLIADGDGLRQVQAGDIAILMRAPNAAASTYQKALSRYGIACKSDRGGSVLDTTEAAVLKSVLEIIDNPHQDIPLLTVLASPVFAVSPEELAKPRTTERELDYYDTLLQMPEKSPKMENFLSWLSEMRQAAQTCSVPELLELILQTTDYRAIFSSMEQGELHRTNIETMVQLADGFCAAQAKNLGAFVAYLRQLQQDGLAPSCAAAEMRTDAVTLTSIHKSKGLEYPVVFLADLSRKFNMQDNRDGILLDPELLIGTNVVNCEQKAWYPSIAKLAIADKKTRQTVAEEMRVLYVAMTRAKDMLILSFCKSKLAEHLKKLNQLAQNPLPAFAASGVSCPGDWILLQALLRTEAGELFAVAGSNPGSTVQTVPWDIHYYSAQALRKNAVVGVMAEQTAAQLPDADWRTAAAYRYGHEAAAKLPSKITATQLKGRGLDEEAAEQAGGSTKAKFLWRRPNFDQERPLTGRERGSATHLFMQFVRYEECQNMDGIERELARLQEYAFLTAKQAEAVDRKKILTLFSSPFGKRILSAQHLCREFKFSILQDAAVFDTQASGEQLMLQGVVDCFWLEPDGVVIVDYKTDHILHDLEMKAAQYAPQLQAYGEALARIYELPVKEKYLYFFDADAAVAV